jgi:hypothetical protein
MVESDLAKQTDPIVIGNLTIVRDVLRWAVGMHWVELTDGAHPWLVAYLLDDPPKLDNTPPETN